MFLTRAVEWRNRIVSIFREAGLAEGGEQWGLLAMSAFGGTFLTCRDPRQGSVMAWSRHRDPNDGPYDEDISSERTHYTACGDANRRFKPVRSTGA
jgi:hypothetical protein